MVRISLIPKFLNPIIPELDLYPNLVQSFYIKGMNAGFEKLVLGSDIYPSLSLTLNVEPPGPDLTLRCSII